MIELNLSKTETHRNVNNDKAQKISQVEHQNLLQYHRKSKCRYKHLPWNLLETTNVQVQQEFLGARVITTNRGKG